MEYLQLTNVFSMLQALLVGLAMGIYYDCFRFFRRLFKSDAVVVAFQDIVFWISSAVMVFFVCIKLNAGFVRIYFVAFAFAGWFVYFMTLGKIAFKLIDAVVNAVSRVLRKAKRLIIGIARKIFTKSKGV